MRFRKTALSVIAISCFALCAAAQTADEGAPPAKPARSTEGWGFFTLGLQHVGLSGLNGPMVSQGYTRFGETFFLMGGGGLTVIDRFIIGGEGLALFDRTATRGPVKARVNAGCGFFDVGYIFWRRPDFRTYGLLGLGGGGWTLRITESADAPFEDVLANPGRSSMLTSGMFLVSLSAGADWLVRLGGDERGEGGMSFGLRAGYTLAPFKNKWKMEDFEITSGPKMGLTGPFVRLVIGFGGRGAKSN